ncbi:HPF/RaiA family ribosome-associated protein [Acidiphilium multivorum]|uniref:HPF/RaiA family ribosome-associated protein n=1 Tax=Acidiphilium multivorum TaxID=62140 RepID=UPI001F4BEB64|nr:HPF/RaiA family ribosome-associated protein [Acidiphilium multivorum]UNC14597.1 HPF/RaiA family ribosome-associated protein [Acidiphilium multivorum]
MTVPLQITFKDIDRSPALEARIREKAEALSRFDARILRCHVIIEAPHRHHHKGKLYRARIEIAVPRGDIVINRESPENHAHEDPYVAVRDAFDAAVRKLEDHARRLDDAVKHHEEALVHGQVVRFVADADYGFIATDDGREVYFHRNSVAGNGFARLRVGDDVRLAVAEGRDGPQASLVRPAGRGG